MRLQINGEDYEVRVQERTVTFCDIMKSGKLVAKGIAIPNPRDVEDKVVSQEMGARIAAGRALNTLFDQTEGFNVRAKTNEIVAKVNKRQFRAAILDLKAKLQETREYVENLKYSAVRGLGYYGGISGFMNGNPANLQRPPHALTVRPVDPAPRGFLTKLLGR